MCVHKKKLYGSGTLVLISLYIYYLNYTGIQMLRLCNNFIPSLSGDPLFSGAYNNMVCLRFFAVGSSSLNLQIMISNDIFLQTSFMKSKQGVFMAPAFLNSLCTQ